MKVPRQNDKMWFSSNRQLVSITILCLATVFYACTGTWGRLSRSPEAAKAFSEHRYIEGYNYFYLGFDSDPEALLGLDDVYILEESFWKPVDPELHSLEKMVTTMEFHLCEHKGYDPRTFDGKRELTGFIVLDPDGKVIGVLYSCFDWFPVEFLGENRIAIAYPEVFQIHREFD